MTCEDFNSPMAARSEIDGGIARSAKRCSTEASSRSSPGDLTRMHRGRLLKRRFLHEVMKGWYSPVRRGRSTGRQHGLVHIIPGLLCGDAAQYRSSPETLDTGGT